tara:strand:- start:938 stop:1690 length:753 start_codon:yes stop_codon:yes gene_type:complete
MKVSIITVCLNSEKFIEKTIQSVINQDYKNVEYIIIDGGSKDNTIDIINKYKQSITKVISEKDKGIYSAINKGIKFATGDVISILHSNDCYFDKKILSEVVQNFKKNKNLDCLIGTTLMTGELNSQIIRKYSPLFFKKWMMYLGISPPHPSMFLKTLIYKKFGIYKENYKIAADFDFYLRIIFLNKVKYKLSGDTYVIMKYGGVSTKSFKSNLISTREILKSFKENNIYNNFFLISLRFPIKFLQFIFKK